MFLIFNRFAKGFCQVFTLNCSWQQFWPPNKGLKPLKTLKTCHWNSLCPSLQGLLSSFHWIVLDSWGHNTGWNTSQNFANLVTRSSWDQVCKSFCQVFRLTYSWQFWGHQTQDEKTCQNFENLVFVLHLIWIITTFSPAAAQNYLSRCRWATAESGLTFNDININFFIQTCIAKYESLCICR